MRVERIRLTLIVVSHDKFEIRDLGNLVILTSICLIL
jgi:hypothetical protein